MTLENAMKLMEEAKKILENNRLYHPVELDENNEIIVEITWGDWKHDHAYVKYLLTTELGLKFTGTEVTESDGSDCYSAIHYFRS